MVGKGAIPDSWFVDSPLFLDVGLVKSMYNALALPEFENEKFSISASDVRTAKTGGQAFIEVSAAESVVAKLLAPLTAKGRLTLSHDRVRQQSDESKLEFRAVESPERRLLNLATYFGAAFPDKVWTVDGLEDDSWTKDAEFMDSTPRPLLFIDVKPGTPIIPMAAELSNGKVVIFYEKMTMAVAKPGGTVPPKYPNDAGAEIIQEYWKWYTEYPSSREAMRLLEETIGDGGRPRWVNYRLPIGDPKSATGSLHLNLRGKQEYDTGDFAYNFVHRGSQHGLRMVGTLRSGPSLNILAVYEK